MLREVESVTPRPGAFVSHGDLLEMKMYRFHSIPTESESLRVGPCYPSFHESPSESDAF